MILNTLLKLPKYWQCVREQNVYLEQFNDTYLLIIEEMMSKIKQT